MTGPAALTAFLTENDITREAAADALKVSRTALYYWLTGRTAPGEQARRDIETWTGGKVAAASWGPLADHRKKSGDVEPFVPAEPEATEPPTGTG